MKQVMHNLYKNSTDNNDERYLDIYVKIWLIIYTILKNTNSVVTNAF